MRVSRVVKSDEEVRQEAREAGQSAMEAGKLIDERVAAREAAQAEYDTKPPVRPYRQD
jgi:hypothetical protein